MYQFYRDIFRHEYNALRILLIVSGTSRILFSAIIYMRFTKPFES